MKPVQVLFVCLGNICRSPTAEAVFRDVVKKAGLSDRIVTDSAGTAAYHIGKQADERSRATARGRGIEMEDLRARKVDVGDFFVFDYVLAMDQENLWNLEQLALDEHKGKARLLMEFAPEHPLREVPDPYYGGEAGFHQVFEMVTLASQGLLQEIRHRHGF